MSVDVFKRRISKYLPLELDLVVNENRCTMLNLLERRRARARLSMHRMFLDAPESVISAIAHYVRGTCRGSEGRNLILRGYIQENLSQYDYSYLIDPQKLTTAGNVYDLKEMYDRLNYRYFNGRLDLQITWYGIKKKKRNKVIFGQYYDSLRLIKIHRILDDRFFPDYFVELVIYHEMLHHTIPGHVNVKGFYCSHGEEFKREEKKFREYEAAIAWEKKNRQYFFK